MKILIANIVSVILSIGSIVLAFKGMDGWGWFLFGAIITIVYPKSISTKK